MMTSVKFCCRPLSFYFKTFLFYQLSDGSLKLEFAGLGVLARIFGSYRHFWSFSKNWFWSAGEGVWVVFGSYRHF